MGSCLTSRQCLRGPSQFGTTWFHPSQRPRNSVSFPRQQALSSVPCLVPVPLLDVFSLQLPSLPRGVSLILRTQFSPLWNSPKSCQRVTCFFLSVLAFCASISIAVTFSFCLPNWKMCFLKGTLNHLHISIPDP